MSKLITKPEAFALLLKTCPDAQEAWEEHLLEWEGEHETVPYLGVSVFARHIVDSFEAGKKESFPAVFQLIERLIVEGDEEVRSLAIVGLLEDIQNIASWRDFRNEVFTKWLGPHSRAAWYELKRVWAGKNSLAGVIRSERVGE
jgi:hypothetical protein